MNGRLVLSALFALCVAAATTALAQNRLDAYPGAARYKDISPRIAGSIVSGAITPIWASDGKSFTYSHAGKRWRLDIGSAAPSEIPEADTPAAPGRAGRGGGRGGAAAQQSAPPPPGAVSSTIAGVTLARGRGGDNDVRSPNGTWRAITRQNNIYLMPADGGDLIPVTTDGTVAGRIRNGTASYVYIEELNMGPALWWSPDSKKLAYLRFDEQAVEDYHVPLALTERLAVVHTQAYPSPGTPNPVPDLYVYDLESRTATRMDVRAGKPFTDEVIGHYIWAVDWTRDGAEVLLRRAARDQKTIELAACAPVGGACRTVVAESQPQSWAEVSAPRFLEDGKRFIWISERNGWRNLYLYDLTGRRLATLTDHRFEVSSIAAVDEARGEVWYLSRDGDNHMKQQLRRVRLDGSGDVRLTDPAFHHTITLSPDRTHFVDVAQTHDTPPAASLMTRDGRRVASLTTSSLAEYEALGLRRVELFTYTSADGVTPLHGMLHFPSSFDPARKYPVLVSVYGGPGATGARETFTLPNGLTEYGFLLVTLDLRGTSGRGKAISDMFYEGFGIVEIDDMAAAVRQLARRDYVDGEKVGVFGTSYGGYASAMAILRYPDVFAAAVANSPVTDYRFYDSTYTERYLGMPGPNKAVYDAGSALTHAANLRGDLMIYYGTSDDNVHPKNSLMLIEALQRAGKRFEVQVGPDRGHTAVSQARMMEFFIESLVLPRPFGPPNGQVAERAD